MSSLTARLNNKLQEINISEKSCTQELINEWKITRPFHNVKILLNVHLTEATLLLVELFVVAGAKLHVGCTDELVCHEPIKKLLIEADLYLSSKEIKEQYAYHYFDVAIDCGAYLVDFVHPKIGFVELTHVEDTTYSVGFEYPVISVDQSLVKKLETTYGTGDGFIRAMDLIYTQQMRDFREKKYMIFGFGKVGQGISVCLQDSGVPKKNIFIIEPNLEKQQLAKTNEYSVFSPFEHIPQIIDLLQNNINCAVTATGIKEVMSKHFSSSIFMNVEYLANMGTYDEWGESFSENRILNKKQPVNFMLHFPTKIFYLDPIFALLASATLDMTIGKFLKDTKIQKPDVSTESKILDIWLKNNHIHKNTEWLFEECNGVTFEQTDNTSESRLFNTENHQQEYSV